MTFQIEFPDFDAATMPAIPAGFEDVSWHNDTCPSFLNETAGLIIFVDFANPSDREFPETVRFTLHTYNEGIGETIAESDDCRDIETAILARAFGRQLQKDLTPLEFAEVNARNAAETDSAICHSHDFCDASMVMLAAFKGTFDRSPVFLNGSDTVESEADIALWGSAWNAAKAASFFA